MKRFTSLVSILVCLAMILAMIPAVFAAEGDTFVKVTDVADLAAGDQIIIVSVDDDYALGTNQKSNNRGGTAITKDGDKVTATADVQVLTLEAGTVDGTFAFGTGEGYLYAASSSKNYLRTETTLSANSSWSISITDGVASIVAQGEYTRATMQYNPNNGVPLFACYASASQSAIAIYKLAEETGEETEPENPLALGTNTLTSGVTYTYTVPADGRLELDILTVKDSADSTIYSYTFNQGTRVQVLVDGEPITPDAQRQNVTAGQVITVQVVSVDDDTYTVTMSLAEVEPAEVLILGNNDVAQDLEYVYTAEQDGTLYVSIVELLYNGEQSTEDDLGSSILYQINGASVSSFEKSYEVKAGDETAIIIEDYSWDGSGTVSAVICLSYEGFYEHAVGSLANPVELLYADCPTQTIEIAAGTAVWYELESYYDDSSWSNVYPFDDKNLVVTGENAYVIVGSTRYDAVDGVVTVMMDTTTMIQIGNDGAEAAIFDLSISIPEGHKDNPQDLAEGDNVITLPSYTSHYYDFVATVDGTVTVTISGDNWRVYFYHYDAEGNELAQEDRFNKNGDSDTFTVEIKAGESIVLNVGTSKGYSQPGGELTVSFSFEPAETVEPEPENLLVLGDNTLTSGVEYTYVVPADGRLELDILTVKDSTGSTIYSYTFNQGTRVQVLVDGEPITLDATRCNVTAGQKITVQVVSVDGDTYTVSLKLTDVEPAEELVLGKNNVTQDLEYVYIAEQDGTLYISIVELLYNGELTTEDALGSSVKYTINGVSVSAFDKSYEVKAGDEIAVVIVDYSWDDSGTVSAVINLSYEGFFEHPAGSLNNPVDLLYADCPTQTIEIPAGSAVWYELESYYDNSAWTTVYPFNGRDLIVEGDGAYVIVGGTRYDAVNGVVTVRMDTTTMIQIGNDGAEAAIFDLKVSIPEGDKDNPQDLVEGDNVINLGSYKSYYFDFAATEDGTVTITISGDNWRVYFYHYDAEGNELAQEDRFYKNGDSDTFTVEIKAGESIVLNVGTSKGYSQPGGELTVNFHFEPAECKHENMGEWEVYTEATCTEAGEERSYCANCDHYESRVIEAKGHEMGEWTVHTEATCTEAGEERSCCANCDHYESRVIEAKGHEMGEWTVYTEATCTEAGEERSYCANCDHYESRVIEAKGHEMGEWTVHTEATCTEAGEERSYCANCDHYESRVIEAKGHEMGEWTVHTEATCTEAGEERSYCANCDHYESRVIEAKGHEMGEWTVHTEATCTEAGEERSCCANCDHYESRVIEAKGHNYVEGVCSTCGEADPNVGGNPDTGNSIFAILVVTLISGMGVVALTVKKKEF